MKFQRIIVITGEESRYLQETFGVSSVTVWHAVKYLRNNEIHRKIRKAAIERGNPRMVLSPEFETIYLTNREDADKGMTRYMMQNFENGATLEVNMATGLVEIRNRRGDVKGQWQNPQICGLTAIQEVAMSL